MAAYSPIGPPGTLLGGGIRRQSGFPAPAGYRTRCHRSRRQRSPIYLFCDKHRTVAVVPWPSHSPDTPSLFHLPAVLPISSGNIPRSPDRGY